MITLRHACSLAVMVAVAPWPVSVGADDSLEDNFCIACHGNTDLWEGDTLHLLVTVEDLAGDIHWQKGIQCQDCHGGNAETFDLREAHAIEDGFRKIESPADVPQFCGHCHSNLEYMRRYQPAANKDVVAEYLASVHGKHLSQTGGEAAATCLSCHPKHVMRKSDHPQSAVHPTRLAETCGSCHREQLIDTRKSVHFKAGAKDASGAGTLLACTECHGDNIHGMLPVKDAASPVFLEHQVQVCGGCHEDHHATYEQSVHGHGLRQSGLLVTAVCADCHGAHSIYYAADRRSTLHASNIADTCGQCHRFIEDALNQSVHGPGMPGDQPNPEGSGRRKPSCTDCHQGHDQPHPDSPFFRMQLPNRCGNCHPGVSERYRLSLHGQLTQLGYEPAAKCSDCHGAHDILHVADPQSHLAGKNRLQTCRKCHTHAVAGFAGFDPHASHKEKDRYPLLYGVCFWLEIIIYVIFATFLIHALAWFVRSFLQTLIWGRSQRLAASEGAIVVAGTPRRVVYILLLVSFPGLALTGLPLKYSSQPWAAQVANLMGGFESTRIWHHFFAVIVLSACAAHVWWGAVRISRMRKQRCSWRQILSGPDSSVLRWRDLKDLAAMLRWFVGLGRKPGFERWTYWEKSDYWFTYYAVAIVGLSGLVLWQPNVFCRILPGGSLNLAKTVHAEVALMAASFLFGIHLFNTHLRPEKFPVDLSVFTGLVSEEHLRNARPEYIERLQQEGRLEELRCAAPSKGRLWLIGSAAFALLMVGLLILLGVIIAQLGK